MPQEHQVLRCVSCETFQAHIVKKSKKWECKMCGTKQSLKRNYGKGSGKDCRAQVMKLNELRMQQNEPDSVENMDEDEDEAISTSFDNFNESFEPAPKAKELMKPQLKSKWSEFLDKIEESNEDEPELEEYYTWGGNSNKRKRKRYDTVESKKKDFEMFENTEMYHGDEITHYDDIENSKPEFTNITKEADNVKKRALNTNNKWSKYSDYLENDSEEFEEPKPKKVLTTFNQLSDVNLDDILDF